MQDYNNYKLIAPSLLNPVGLYQSEDDNEINALTYSGTITINESFMDITAPEVSLYNGSSISINAEDINIVSKIGSDEIVVISPGNSVGSEISNENPIINNDYSYYDFTSEDDSFYNFDSITITISPTLDNTDDYSIICEELPELNFDTHNLGGYNLDNNSEGTLVLASEPNYNGNIYSTTSDNYNESIHENIIVLESETSISIEASDSVSLTYLEPIDFTLNPPVFIPTINDNTEINFDADHTVQISDDVTLSPPSLGNNEPQGTLVFEGSSTVSGEIGSSETYINTLETSENSLSIDLLGGAYINNLVINSIFTKISVADIFVDNIDINIDNNFTNLEDVQFKLIDITSEDSEFLASIENISININDNNDTFDFDYEFNEEGDLLVNSYAADTILDNNISDDLLFVEFDTFA